MSIALGVGSSTLAIINFFVAIADGKIDETERKMMGVVYVLLRVAMILILGTTLLLLYLNYEGSISTFTTAQLAALAVLFLNAVLMTAHLMPSTFGPAIQAGSWYTLGVLSSLQILGHTDFTLMEFILAYITWIILAIGIVNGTMAILKEKKLNKKS